MIRTKRSADLYCVVALVATLGAWAARPAYAQSALCDCICAAVSKYLKPTRVNTPGGGTEVHLNGSHDSGSAQNPPALDAANTDMQDFANEVRRCVSNDGGGEGAQVLNLECECVVAGEGGPQTFTLDVSCDVSGDAITNSGSADIVIAIAGHEAAGSTSNGEQATATNNSAGGAAVAVGGNGGGNNAAPGTGGPATSTASNGDAVSVSGAGGDPTNDEAAGGTGGTATSTNNDGTATQGGTTGGVGTPGYHGGGAWAKSGQIGPGLGSAARKGHGGGRYNDVKNTNYAPGSDGL